VTGSSPALPISLQHLSHVPLLSSIGLERLGFQEMLIQKNLPRKVRGSGNAFLKKTYPERFGVQEMLLWINLPRKVWGSGNAFLEKPTQKG
jgi:hypothetical protein